MNLKQFNSITKKEIKKTKEKFKNNKAQEWMVIQENFMNISKIRSHPS